jgi:hypothetical protein
MSQGDFTGIQHEIMTPDPFTRADAERLIRYFWAYYGRRGSADDQAIRFAVDEFAVFNEHASRGRRGDSGP